MPCLDVPERPYRIGYASGCFDIFHVGHLRYLRQAAGQCEQLIVGIPVDAIVNANKGKRPIVPCAQRMEIIAALSCVTQVVQAEVPMEHTAEFAEFMSRLGIDAVFIGEDWRSAPRWQRLEPVLQTRGIAVHFLPRTPDISTTGIKRMLKL